MMRLYYSFPGKDPHHKHLKAFLGVPEDAAIPVDGWRELPDGTKVYYNVDVLFGSGQVYRPDGVDAQGQPKVKAHVGWCVNILWHSDVLPPDMAEYRTEWEGNPPCVFG